MFVIFTDTSANLPTPYLKEHDVKVIPFTYNFDGKELTCLDTESFDADDYYQRLRTQNLVNTSQITPQKYIDSFTPYLNEGNDILFISMSSGISGSYGASVVACEQLKQKYPERQILTVDTLAASLGEGIFVMDAVNMRDNGMSIEEIYNELTIDKQALYQVVVVDDLKHLKRTGRLSGKAALIGSVLNIKPILKGTTEGMLVMCDKVRGKKAALKYLAEKYAKLCYNAINQVVGIAHAGCREDAELLGNLLKSICAPKELLIVDYEPVTGAHIGPGTVALFFKGKLGVREL